MAWSSQGHLAVGAIAYDRLAGSDPQTVAAVLALLTQHPDHARFDAALMGLTGADRDRVLFELAARWPDDIRHTRYNHTHWHHQLRVISGWRIAGVVRLGAADHAFFHGLKVASDTKADPGRRAIALCWLFHVLADMHQPLHAGHRMDARFPLTDRAGTLGWVRAGQDARAETLHHFWDGAADRSGDEAAGADAIARAAESMLIINPVELQGPKADYRAAVRESEQVAATIAYRDAALDEAHRPENAPFLSGEYVADARRVAEERLGQAGARLADVLHTMFSGAAVAAVQGHQTQKALSPAPMLHPEQ